MSHAYWHAVSSVRRWGGTPENYLAIHNWLDDSKRFIGDARHRAIRHHTEGTFEAEKVFGCTITNSDGHVIGVREICERHIREDTAGMLPTIKDWLSRIRLEPWMNRTCEFKDTPTE